MASAFNKDIRRSITHSLGRFIAIFGIVALGVGFYAGLRMTAPDMKIAADRFYDNTALMDLRVVSTMGMTESDMDALRDVEGVAQVMPAYETDALGTYDEETYAFRVHSLAEAAAESETLEDGFVVSDADDYLNRLILLEGRWPSSPDECVILGDVIMGSEVRIGEKVLLTEGSGNLDSTLTQQEFTIVGLVRSSYYTDCTTLGATSIGSGTVDQAIYVPADAFDSDYPITEAFITVQDAKDIQSDSPEYEELVSEVQDRILAIAGEREEVRLEDLRSTAQAELDDARAEYESQRAEAESKLADAEDELTRAQEKIESGERDLAKGRSDYDSGVKKYESEKAKTEAQLAAAQTEIDTQTSQLSSQKESLQKQSKELAAQKKTLTEQKAQLEAGIQTLDQNIAALEASAGANPPAEIAAQLTVLRTQRATAAEQLSQVSAGLTQVNSGVAQVDNGLKAVAEGERKLEAARKELSESRATAESGFVEAKNKLDSSANTIASSEKDLEQGKRDLEEGRAEYADSRAKADSELADARQKLDDAQAEIDSLERPEWLVLDRTKAYGAESFRQDGERVDRIASVFPFIFFLVAALVALTTMTRMVDEERMQIGTLKALGYGRSKIMSKYLIYAGIASICGSIVGIAVLSFVLPAVIMSAYSIIYVVPTTGLTINWPIALLSAGLGVGITLGATAAAAWATMHETPAALMLPPAPKPGKRILLERIRPIWNHLTFLWKVTMRNIFRYKKRFLMTVIGIAGCTALLLTGFGLQNSINDIIDKHYGPIVDYTIIISQDEDAPEEDTELLQTTLTEVGKSDTNAQVMRDSLLVVGATNEEGADLGKTSQSHDTNIMVPQDTAVFSKIWNLHDRLSGDAISFSDNGVIVTEKLAATYGAAVGDNLLLSDKDSMGNAVGDPYAVPIVGVAENYVGNYVFFTPEFYKQTFGEAPVFSVTLGTVPEDEQVRTTFAEAAAQIESVRTVEYNDDVIESYRTSLKSVNMVVVVLIVAAAALAFIVLYNLTNINITERVREIATLKVLGFTAKEVRTYIFREIVILTIVGALCGLVLGVFLENFVVVTAEVDKVMFGREIHPTSFLYAFVLTVAFGFLVMLAMGRKLRAVSMVESLKSVE